MKPAVRSRSWLDHAVSARIRVVLGAVLAFGMFPASVCADDAPQSHQLLVIPDECAPYWLMPGGIDSPAGWNQVLSFAACVQDATIAHIERLDEIEDVVQQLQASLESPLQMYIAAIEQGPGPVKVRAALHVAMAQAALITRARASIAAPADLRTNPEAAARYRALHERLESVLEPRARLACTIVAVIDRAVAGDPALAPDPMTRNMLASARTIAALLRKTWSLPPERATFDWLAT